MDNSHVPVDHSILRKIYTDIDARQEYETYRESESVIFLDGHQWYEMVVRPIAPPNAL